MKHNFQQAIAVLVVVFVAISLHATAAYPQQEEDVIGILRHSGISDQQTRVRIDFDLVTSVLDANPDRSIGSFPGAIRNFENIGNPGANLPSQRVFLPVGDITASRVKPNQLPNNISLEQLRNTFRDPNATRFTENNIVQYEVSFGNNPERLFLFAPGYSPNAVNSLSGLRKLNVIQGLFRRNDGTFEEYGIGTGLSIILVAPPS